MSSLAVTVVGHDRPGIIAAAADALAGCGMNLEDSSMTLLRGHFAMTLVCAGEASVEAVREALEPLATSGLDVAVREVVPDPDEPLVQLYAEGETEELTGELADEVAVFVDSIVQGDGVEQRTLEQASS